MKSDKSQDELLNNEQGTGVHSVQESIPNLIREVISRLRERGMSYSKIGERLGISKSQAQMIFKKTWYPKQRAVENRILEALYSV